ncbi:hypothetical protein FKM82_029032 [Ascaphus truei]
MAPGCFRECQSRMRVGDIAFRFVNYICAQRRNSTTNKLKSQQDCPGQRFLGPTSRRTRGPCWVSRAVIWLSWVVGDAEELPFASDKFDVYTIAFGIRNVTHIEQALQEAYRVLKVGGRFLCLEFSQVNNPLLARLYDLYSFQVIPVLGEIIAGDWKSYQYLVESIRCFPPQEEFKAMIEEAGFCQVKYHNLTSGVVAVHSGFKL